tara:strand:+ start:1202 stop:1756 length:555 start_codon:yes stop_codon:yes gene_type:complete
MSNALFDICPSENLFSEKRTEKSVATDARRHRAGFRAGSQRGVDSGLEVTSSLRKLSYGQLKLFNVIRQIKSVCLTDRQVRDSFEQPNSACRKNARTAAVDLFEAFDLLPSRIAASVEGGILLAYKRGGDLRMEIEIDNDGDITGAISTSKEVLQTEMIDLPAKLSKLVRDFRLSQVPAVSKSA